MIEMKPCDYSSKTTPEGYICGCGKSGVKLWRDYQTFLNHQSLKCVDCACEHSKKDASLVRADGKIKYNDFGHEAYSDQLGWLVPAVPTEEGDTFWGYTSVPQAGCDWWYGLPLRNENERPNS